MDKLKVFAIIQQFNKELKIIIGSILALLVIGFGVSFFTQSKPVETVSTDSAPENLVRDFNHRMGPDSAKVKIVEFYDPECEACSAFFPYVKEIMKRHKDKVQLIVRYALYHGNSKLAAKASDAAALQGKFWEYQEVLFTSQNEWSHQKQPATSFFLKYAKDLGMDVAKFETDMKDLRRMETINIDLEDGPKVGVNGTPTIFINGKKLDRINPDYFNEKVEEALAK
ncbi:disulfide bond formation protein DsbA [Bacteriovorax stolpii]|uniref:Disulfide bond formation protein DsbA n=1 Tax=Bacteriovorax stolpii TaxID=960 RepID=A0A2K9NQA9_BACTC|nr:thioredoxin domain-containing protein [Bacteriovorax stolpii]AUN97693.1 disulfide bond formation protein DsbA [Bacteriovorax stolpii]TDP51512.1 thioredoxin-like protein [Bacteriovorax stolpii]